LMQLTKSGVEPNPGLLIQHDAVCFRVKNKRLVFTWQ
jgi:hypothetical protein